MEEIKPRIIVIGEGYLEEIKPRIVVIGYLEEIKPRIIVIGYLEEIKPRIGDRILGGDKALYRSDRRRDTWRR